MQTGNKNVLNKIPCFDKKNKHLSYVSHHKFCKQCSLTAKCAKTEDLSKAKSNILTNFYKLDNNDQYQRREN